MPLRRKLFLMPLLIAPALAGGCASLDPRGDYAQVGQAVALVVGQGVECHPDAAREAGAEARRLMEDGLSLDEAVRVALLTNPLVRAGMLRAGVARADVVQAGLLSNPTLGISLRLPEGGGLSNLDLGIAQNVADLWMIPARVRAAERDLARTILDVAREICELATEVKLAYAAALAATESHAIAQDNLSLCQRLLEISEARLEAGALSSLDVNLVRGVVLQAQVRERNARLLIATSRRALVSLLGLPPGAESALRLSDSQRAAWAPSDAARLVAAALESRLDLKAAREQVRAARIRLEFEYARVFQHVELGFELEREARRALPGRDVLADTARASIAGGALTAPEVESRAERQRSRSEEIEAILGPSLAVTLPLFDQNQAQIAKARLELERAVADADGLELEISRQTQDAVDRAVAAADLARLYEREAIPQVVNTVTLSRSSYEAGQTGVLSVLDAQRALLEVQELRVAALQAGAQALADLEQATGRPLSFLISLEEH